MTQKRSRQEREKARIECTILQHAEALFRQVGYGNTSMDALAESCEYTKRTIYRYFACKEDLYFAVLYKGHMQLLAGIRTAISKGGTGYESIQRCYAVFHHFFLQDTWLFYLMAQIKTIKSNKDPQALPWFQRYAGCTGEIHEEILALFEMAQKEGSIRTDVDATQLGFSSIFLLEGFYHTLVLMGDSFTTFFALDKEQFIEQTMKLLFQILGGEGHG